MRAVTIFVCGMILALCGCSNSPNTGERNLLAGKIGQNCTVQFRRGDGLGGGGNVPIPPTTNAMNGAEVSVGGKLQAVEGNWIVVGVDKQEYYIPRESILLIQFSK